MESHAFTESNAKYLSLAEASRRLGTIDGRRPSTTSLWRWCRHGLRGVRLEYSRIGRRIVTTDAALRRFIDGLTELDERVDAPRTKRRRPRNRRDDDFDRDARREGI